VNGKVYFKCARFHGSFVQPDQCVVVKRGELQSSNDAAADGPKLPFLSQITSNSRTTDTQSAALSAGQLPPIRKLEFRERPTGAPPPGTNASAEDQRRLSQRVVELERYVALLRSQLGDAAPPLPPTLALTKPSSLPPSNSPSLSAVSERSAPLASRPHSVGSPVSAFTSAPQSHPTTSPSPLRTSANANTPAKPPPPVAPAKPPPPPKPTDSEPSSPAHAAGGGGPPPPPPKPEPPAKPSLPSKPRPKSADPKSLAALVARTPADAGGLNFTSSDSSSSASSSNSGSSGSGTGSDGANGAEVDRPSLMRQVSLAQSVVAGKGFSGRSAVPASSSSSTISGSFVVKLCDANGEQLDLPGMGLKAMITGPRGQVIEAKCVDNSNGSYDFSYDVEGTGDYTVIITCDGAPVADSPYTKSYFASGDKKQRPMSIGIKNKFKSFRGDVTDFLNK